MIDVSAWQPAFRAQVTREASGFCVWDFLCDPMPAKARRALRPFFCLEDSDGLCEIFVAQHGKAF